MCDAYLSFDLEADSFKLLPRQDPRDANMFCPRHSNFQCRMQGISYRAIGVEAANAGANDGAACSCSVAAHHVHTTGTGKVNGSSIEIANVAAGIGSGPAITELRLQRVIADQVILLLSKHMPGLLPGFNHQGASPSDARGSSTAILDGGTSHIMHADQNMAA